MKAIDIVERLKAAAAGKPLDWTMVREEISKEYPNADHAERVNLLRLYTTIMNAVDHGLSGQDLDKFRIARRQDYNRLLVSECLTDGNVSPEALAAVINREIEAGRMSPDDELCRLAVAGAVVLQETVKPATPMKRPWSINRALQGGAIFGACYTAAGAVFPNGTHPLVTLTWAA